MSPSLPDPYINEGDWDGVQRNFDAIMRLMVDTGGQQAGIRFAPGTLTWPGASPFSNVLTLAHGLGRAPVTQGGWAQLPGGVFPCLVSWVAVDATNIQWRGYAADASSPAAATTRAFTWIAIG